MTGLEPVSSALTSKHMFYRYELHYTSKLAAPLGVEPSILA